MSRSILLLFSSRSFMVSSLTFRPLIHFEFIFVYGVRKCSNFTTWGHPLYVSCKALLFPFLGFHSLTPPSPSFFLTLNNWAASTIFYFLKLSQLIKTWGLGRVDSGSAWAGFTWEAWSPGGGEIGVDPNRPAFSLLSLTTQPCICKVGTLRKCSSKVRKRKTNVVYAHICVESRKTV